MDGTAGARLASFLPGASPSVLITEIVVANLRFLPRPSLIFCSPPYPIPPLSIASMSTILVL